MQPQQKLINEALNQIPDPHVRQLYANILTGKATHRVHCDSPNCKGRVIAHIMAPSEDGRVQVVETPPVANKKGAYGLYTSGLESSRMRLDGQWGFKCYCGNNSILAEAERGIITSSTPTVKDLEAITRNINAATTAYRELDGKLTVDGFTIERTS